MWGGTVILEGERRYSLGEQARKVEIGTWRGEAIQGDPEEKGSIFPSRGRVPSGKREKFPNPKTHPEATWKRTRRHRGKEKTKGSGKQHVVERSADRNSPTTRRGGDSWGEGKNSKENPRRKLRKRIQGEHSQSRRHETNPSKGRTLGSEGGALPFKKVGGGP